MKFVVGNPPIVMAPELDQKVWRQFTALGAKAIQNYGLIVSGAGMLLVGFLLDWAISPSNIWKAILVLILTLPFHELIHALTTPKAGLTDRTVIGLQTGKHLMLPYMYYDGVQSVWQMLFTGLAPVLLLTVFPVVLVLLVPMNATLRADLSFLAFFNVAISGGDLVNFYWLITHLPLRAVVKGNGWTLLWKDENQEEIDNAATKHA